VTLIIGRRVKVADNETPVFR